MKISQLRICILFVIVMIVGNVLITNHVAYNLNYHFRLGAPDTCLFHMPIYYNPFKWLYWAYGYFSYAQEIFWIAIKQFLILTGGCIAAALLFNIKLQEQTDDSNTYGSAKWADKKDIKKAKLDAKYGVALGKYPCLASKLARLVRKLVASKVISPNKVKKIIDFLERRALVIHHDGPEHILINAPSRSGKGVGVIIPTLLSWGHSVVVMDIKGENWALTSGFRSEFSYCMCFNPTSSKSAKWNPLLEIRRGENEVKDIQNIADILVDPTGTTNQLNHWQLTGHSLVVALLLHVLYVEPDKTLSGAANFLSNPDSDIKDTLKNMMGTNHLGDRPHPVVASAAREMLNKSDNELSGVVSTAMSFFGLYRDPIVANNTSDCDFYIDDIMNAEFPMSVYLVVPPSDISRLRPLTRLFINMMLRRLTEKEIGASGSPHQHRLLMLLDEFPSLGSMDFFKTSLGFLAGYGIKCMLITQSFNNIYELYGNKNSIFDNCHIQLIMAPNDNDTAKQISIALGQKTIKRSQVNFAGKRLSLWLSNVSVASQESARNLLNDDEIKRLPFENVIIMVAQNYPVMADKILFYQDERYEKRLLAAVELGGGEYKDKPPKRVNDWFASINTEIHSPDTPEVMQGVKNDKKIEPKSLDSALKDKLLEPLDNSKVDKSLDHDLNNQDADMDFEVAEEVTLKKEIMF